MRSELRIVDTDLEAPAMTAAIDEAILEHVADSASPPTLHFYRRSPAAVTIGYFQSAYKDVNLPFCRENGIPVVRRTSGGGAIFTDYKQLVFGLSTKGLLPRAVEASYGAVCNALARGLGDLGAECVHSPVNDVLCDGRKVSGSAQVRRKGAVLHHGTVLVDGDLDTMFKALRVQDIKMSDKGITSPRDRVTTLGVLLGSPPAMSDVKQALSKAFGELVGMGTVAGQLTGSERATALRLEKDRYSRDAWNLRR